MNHSTLTERGQVSVPATLRHSLKLHPGQRLLWEKISDREMRVTVEPAEVPGPLSILGYARKLRDSPPRSTAAWMAELRAGENRP